jgi:thioredoxin-related protein
MSRAALSTVLLTFAASLPCQDGGWIQDFTKAKAQAKAEHKHLLIDFTGSDWCGWCIKLDKEVFSQEPFQAGAPKDFVLVKLDYPRDQSLVTDEIRAQNEQLQQQYEIRGYPTILLTDAEGRPYAQTGYEQGGPEKYMAMLAEMKKRGDVFQAALAGAEGKQGAERATALDAALSALDEAVASSYHLATMEEIVKLDADGKAGLKTKYEEKVAELAMGRDLNREAQALDEAISPMMEAGEADKAIAHLDGVINAPKSKIQHQLALFFKGMVIMDSTQDVKAAIAALESAKKVLPKSPLIGRIEQILPEFRKQLDESGEKEEKQDGDEK